MIKSLIDQGQICFVRMKKADPTQISPLATCCKFARILPANSAQYAVFCRLCRFVSTVPSIIWPMAYIMAWKRSSVRS